jgi:hypothetical protein
VAVLLGQAARGLPLSDSARPFAILAGDSVVPQLGTLSDKCLLGANVVRDARTETGLRGWGERTRTRKCRFKKISLARRPNRLAFQNILGPEIFRGKAANNLTCRSGAKTVQFEIGCPLGR